jgi:D-aspartate ligase
VHIELSRSTVRSKKPVAVVLGINPNALGTIKSLRAKDIPVIAIAPQPAGIRDPFTWMSSKTSLCEKVFYSAGNVDGLIECLISTGKLLNQKGVLFPSSDTQISPMSRMRDTLASYFEFALPSDAILDTILDKAKFYAFAQQNNIPHPRTHLVKSAADAVKVSLDMAYPCLVKPALRDPKWAALFPGSKAIAVATPKDLIKLFQNFGDEEIYVLVQEMIEGPDSNLYFSHAYLDRDLKPLALWTGHKVRQFPIHFGTSTLTECIWVDDVASHTLKILKGLHCQGYSSVEFKKDIRDGAYKVMEVTAGRTWYPHYLGVAAGVNIPYIWYNDLLGIPQEPPARAQNGVRWVDEIRDFYSALAYWKNGELSLAEWIRSYWGVKGYAMFSWRDPLPGVCTLLRFPFGPPPG